MNNMSLHSIKCITVILNVGATVFMLSKSTVNYNVLQM